MAAANSQEPLESPIKESLEAEKSRLEQLRSYDRSYDELHQLLEELPKKTTHRITVHHQQCVFAQIFIIYLKEKRKKKKKKIVVVSGRLCGSCRCPSGKSPFSLAS